MAWIEAHQQLERHKKTKKLARLMGWSIYETIGRLLCFWWWCVDYAENGDLRKHNDADVADAVALNGENASKFVNAMVESEFIDRKPYFRVHDWWDYIGLFLQRKYGERSREKWEKVKMLYSSCTNAVQQLSQPNLTKPNLTKPNLTKPKVLKELKNKDLAESISAQTTNKPKKKEKTNPDIKHVIDHICTTWEAKKGIKYPFNGKHAKLIQYQVNRYEASGVMSLWDLYLQNNSEDPFFAKCGYSIEGFVTSIPKLADAGYKSLKQKYEQKLGFQPAGELLKTFGVKINEL